MRPSELLDRVLGGEFLIVGEYRGGAAYVTSYVDRKTGKAISRLMITHLVECTVGGLFGYAKILANAPDGISAPEEVTISLQRGQRYAFPVQSVTREREVITAWLGKAEPLRIDAD